jgi:hypothetical protein
MVKAVAWTAVIVGSLSVAVACSSKSNGNGNEFGDSGNEGEDGGGSSSGAGSSSGGEGGTIGCANPLTLFQAATKMTLSSTCTSCIDSSCSGELSSCMSSSSCTSTTCIGVAACVYTSCPICIPDAGSGSSSGASDGGSSSGTSSGSHEGGVDSCAQLQSCCAFTVACGCSALSDVDADAGAMCQSAVSSDNQTECTQYYTLVKSFGGGLVTCTM